LGSSAAIFGHWLETAGPRKAGLASACCWCGGLLISALGVYSHQIYLLWLGSGVIGGIGLGLGYISPVSTLMKWFPDRRGVISVPRRDGRLDRTKRCLDKVLLSIVGDSLSKRTSNLGGK
jgi:MFS family permease